MRSFGRSISVAINSPRGVTGLHLKTSLHTASTSGSLGRSSKVGSRSLPVTASSSFCTIVCTSGRSRTATKNTITEANVYKRGLGCASILTAFAYTLTVSVPAKMCVIDRLSGIDKPLACIHGSQSSSNRFLCLCAFFSPELLSFLEILKRK